MLAGRSVQDQTIEVRIGLSLRGTEQARANLAGDGHSPPVGTSTRFDERRAATSFTWSEHLAKIDVESASAERLTVFKTALYHSLIKPCMAPDESPFWPTAGAFAFDICTMWDIYRTQLPLVTTLFPERAVELANALLHVSEEEGNFPIGYRMARGGDRFFRQGSALAHTFLADLCALDPPGVDWERALAHMGADLRRLYGEEFLDTGVAHPITHTLDLAFGYHCTAQVARRVGDDKLATHFDALATRWVNGYDRSTGLVVDSTFYEGGQWNYSFRLSHDMAARIELAGGEDRYLAHLDRFFGFGQPPVKQLGESPEPEEISAGYALNRFQGLNNESDMEAPWSYHFVGRPDRTADVVHAALTNQFGTGRGGLPGNDDSGALSSWYVWASLGLFPVAGQQLFLLNAPSFPRARINVGQTDFKIETSGFVEPTRIGSPQYVQSATLDGDPFDRSWLTATELHAGGELHLVLGRQRSDWATSTRPPSVSRPSSQSISSSMSNQRA
jgi:predicted alpha-1,2-mannosidase